MLHIYKSSAGSGKTYTLVKEYLKIIIRNPFSFRSILAITFTKAATAEMKNRILRYLKALSSPDNDEKDMMSSLMSEMDVNEEFIRSQAKKAYVQILFNYTHFNVTTIDSFFVKVLKSCAQEVGVETNVAVELENKKVIEAAVEEIVQSEDTQTQKILKDVVLEMLNNDKGWNIENEFKKIGRILFEENSSPNADEAKNLNQDFLIGVEKIRTHNKTVEEKLVEQTKEIIEYLDSSDIKFKAPVKNNIIKFKTKNQFELTAASTKHIENQSYYNKGQDPDTTLDKLIEDFHSIYLQEIDLYNANINILTNILSTGLLGLLKEGVSDYTKEESSVLLDQAYQILSSTLVEYDSPIIYEKTGAKLQYLFLDEFQDTSHMQWNCLLPLVSEVLSKGGNVHVIGDVKQAIYRFRKGDMKLLHYLVEDQFSNKTTINEVPLLFNYRSNKDVVLFNNSVFKGITKFIEFDKFPVPFPEELHSLYEQAEQKVYHEEKEGFISLKTLLDHKDEELSYDEKTYDFILQTITDAQSNGHPLSDISILVRETKTLKKISQFLLKNAIKFQAEGGLYIQKSVYVQVILLTFKFFTETKGAVAHFNINSLLDKSVSIESLTEFKNNNLYLPPRELIKRILHFWGLKLESDKLCIAFVDWVEEISKHQNFSILQFLDLWDKKKNDLRINLHDEDAVKIMTIHKSKGLENKIIILPFSDYELTPKSKSTFWTQSQHEMHDFSPIIPIYYVKKIINNSHYESVIDQEILETIIDNCNILYVALTRARKELHISCKEVLKSQEKITTVNALFKSLIDDDSTTLKLDSTVENRYSSGLQTSTKGVKKGTTPPTITTSPTLVANEEMMKLKVQSAKMFELQSMAGERIKRGNLIHYYFETYAKIKDHKTAIGLVSNQFLLDADSVDWLTTTASSLWENIPELQEWYGEAYEKIAEKSFALQGDIKKPDALFKKGKEIVLLDFKLEKENIKYEKQLQEYSYGLRKMGYNVISKHLLFIETKELVAV